MTNSSSTHHAPFDRTETINMKHRHESEILSELLGLTKATPIAVTEEEEAVLEELKEEERRAEADRVRNSRYTEQKRQEKALLDQARGVIG